jgi:hypothetical protein
VSNSDLRESARAFRERLEADDPEKRRWAEAAEAERQANQQRLEESRRAAVEGMKARLGMDKDTPRR